MPKFKAMNVLDLKPALALRVRVAYVKQIGAPATAQATSAPTWPKKPTGSPRCRSATPTAGRALAAKGGRVRINGRMYPVIASVSASHTIVEIGDDAGREGRRCGDAV